MSEFTGIEWVTNTFNPWEGCTKVSPGCANCYAEARNKRFSGGANWGKGKPRRRTSAATWGNPIKWDAQVEKERKNQIGPFHKKWPRVFPSLCDWLDDEVPIEWLTDFLALIDETPYLDWLLLTKRPENFTSRLEKGEWVDGRGGEFCSEWLMHGIPHNVWVGASAEDQPRLDERIPELLKIPAAMSFLSVEPLLEQVDLKYALFNGSDSYGTMAGVDWIIVGGESGPRARPCNVKWIRDIVYQCKTAGVPCFVKQLGANSNWWNSHPKGGDPVEWPDDLRVREFPIRARRSLASPVREME